MEAAESESGGFASGSGSDTVVPLAPIRRETPTPAQNPRRVQIRRNMAESLEGFEKHEFIGTAGVWMGQDKFDSRGGLVAELNLVREAE